MTKYNTYTLKNGLRIIHLPSPSQVVYCGYQIAAGTRNESSGEEGIAHFCEHMTFKGTERRNAIQIINALEGVGGELNAFTNKEDTVFYAAISKEHFSQAVDILTDIVFHSQYPQHEIEKEVEVICDEIESYNDSPAELIYDDFENIIFEGHPLGHNILGNAEQLRTYTTEDALRFVRRNYRTNNAIFFAYGDVDFAKICKSVECRTDSVECRVENVEFATAAEISCGAVARSSSAGLLPEGRKNSKLYTLNSQLIVRQLSTHQSHVMLGTRAYDIHHPMRIPLYLLNNILGGPGMNARLNISLRERNGLVYTVESTMVSYSDTGIWCIYFGCDSHDIKRCLKLVRRELDKMMQKPLSASQLRNAKRQLKGQIAIACDNREQFALDFGKSFLHYGWEKDITHLYESIDKVTAEDIQKVANELFATNMLTTLIYK
ncbi:MAG: insulinase family protein [Prevotella sp.]|jgi:predicted Zn-dependent peptidase|nr:insulinase family protein [Prevotella sp.]